METNFLHFFLIFSQSIGSSKKFFSSLYFRLLSNPATSIIVPIDSLSDSVSKNLKIVIQPREWPTIHVFSSVLPVICCKKESHSYSLGLFALGMVGTFTSP